MNPARNADLEQAIAADPDDLGAYQVYADWLLERADPRGELIAVSLAIHANPSDTALQRREHVLQAEQAAAFLARIGGDAEIDLSWRFGLLDTLWIQPDPMLEVSAQALTDPLAATLRSLDVTGWSGRDGTDALAGAAALGHLRLATGTRISSEVVAQMCSGLPRLTAIDLRGYSLEPWTGLPAVGSLGVDVRVLRAGALAALLAGRSRDVSVAADALHGDWQDLVRPGIEQFLADSGDAMRRSLGVFHPELARAALASRRLSRLARLGLPWAQLDDDHRSRLWRRDDLAAVELFDRLDPWRPSGDAGQRRRAITARAWVLHRCLDRRDEAAALLEREGLDVAALERDWELALASSHHPGLPAPVAPPPVAVEPDSRSLRQSARRLMRERRFHEAYVFCEHALDRAPGDAELRLRRLEAMFMNGEDISPHLPPALDIVDMLLGGDGGSREDRFEWWNLKGWLCSALERWDEAEVCFRAALALDPSDEPTQARLRITAEIASTEAMFGSD